MLKKKIYILIILALFLSPSAVFALDMPKSADDLALIYPVTAKSYAVADKTSGELIISKEPDMRWTPASITKLMTAMVFLDTKPKMAKIIAMSKDDEVGGARIATKAGVKYKVSDLFYASLVASANNATNAVARSTGLSKQDFVARMNKKAKELGAANTVFLEPTGINEQNYTTASDYVKIANAAFSNPQIHKVAMAGAYSFVSTNNKRYRHNLKNTNKLLSDGDITMLGGKTGYLDESQYNFVTEVKDKNGNDLIVVVFGSQNSKTQFQETKQLVYLGGLAKSFNRMASAVLGTSTISSVLQ